MAPHSGGFSKVESTGVIFFIPEGKTRPEWAGGAGQRNDRQQLSAEEEQLLKTQGYSEKGRRGGQPAVPGDDQAPDAHL